MSAWFERTTTTTTTYSTFSSLQQLKVLFDSCLCLSSFCQCCALIGEAPKWRFLLESRAKQKMSDLHKLTSWTKLVYVAAYLNWTLLNCSQRTLSISGESLTEHTWTSYKIRVKDSSSHFSIIAILLTSVAAPKSNTRSFSRQINLFWRLNWMESI